MKQDDPSSIQDWLLRQLQYSEDRFQKNTSLRPHEHFKLSATVTGAAQGVIRSTPWDGVEGTVAYIDRLRAKVRQAKAEFEREYGYNDPDGFGSGNLGAALEMLYQLRLSLVEQGGNSG